MSNDPNSLPEVWSADRLMGKQVAFKGVGENGSTGADDAPPSPRRRKPKVDAAKIDPMLWGRPGHLTESDYQVFVSARRGWGVNESNQTREGTAQECSIRLKWSITPIRV